MQIEMVSDYLELLCDPSGMTFRELQYTEWLYCFLALVLRYLVEIRQTSDAGCLDSGLL